MRPSCCRITNEVWRSMTEPYHRLMANFHTTTFARKSPPDWRASIEKTWRKILTRTTLRLYCCRSISLMAELTLPPTFRKDLAFAKCQISYSSFLFTRAAISFTYVHFLMSFFFREIRNFSLTLSLTNSTSLSFRSSKRSDVFPLILPLRALHFS